MNKFKRFCSAIGDPKFICNYFITKFSKVFSDKLYIKLKYRLLFGKSIDLVNPQGFNEKLNWLKLYNRNPLYVCLADKYWVKQYVASKIGWDYVVPCYGAWKRIEEVDLTLLPDKAFLKANHDSSGGVLLDSKAGVDMKSLKRRFNGKKFYRKNWYWHLREYPYKYIEPLIVAEEYLKDGTNTEIRDYKFYCFNGRPTYMYVTNKGIKIYENFYDMDFNPVDISHGYERVTPEFKKPENFDKMKEFAALLSKNIPFVRIDFFNVNGRLYFGEYTFYDWGGMKPLNDKWEITLGNLINIDLVKIYA